MDLKSDAVAEGLSTGPDGQTARDPNMPLVTLRGWVSHTKGAPTVKVITDPYYERWLEIPANKVVHQLCGSECPDDAGRSYVWIEKDAVVTAKSCRTATAGEFAEGEGMGIVDPAGGYGGSSGRRP